MFVLLVVCGLTRLGLRFVGCLRVGWVCVFAADCFRIGWWLVNSVVFMFFFVLYTFVLFD